MGSALSLAPLIACLFTSPRPGTARASTPATTVPIEVMRSKHIAVQVKLNGKGPYRMVLDTGSPVTFISIPLAEDLGLVGKVEGSSAPFFRLPTSIHSVDVGGVQVQDLTVMILDHPTIELLSQVEGPIHGIVGYSFFARFRTTLDYQKGEAGFQAVPYHPEDVVQSLMNQALGAEPPQKVLAPAGLWGIVVAPSPEGASVRVLKVYPGSAAAAAGLQIGDRISRVGRRWTTSPQDLFDAATHALPGAPVSVTVMRSGKEQELLLRPRAGV